MTKNESREIGPVARFPLIRDVLRANAPIRIPENAISCIDWARKNKIAPFLACKVLEQDINNAELHAWAQDYRGYCIKRSRLVLEELRVVFQGLDASNIRGVVVVENFATLVATQGDLGCFPSGDVDLMAPRHEAERIGKCIVGAGWRKTVRRGITDGIMTTYEKELDDDIFYLNIEWKFVSRRFFIREKNLARRMEYWRTNNYIRRVSGINVLSADANFYLNCMHISIGHYYGTTPGLRLYKDLEPYLSGGHYVSPQRVMSWAEEDGTGLRLETCLSLYQALYDETYPLPIPVSAEAARVSDMVQAALNSSEISMFSRLQEIRIDYLSEKMTLPAYLALRLTLSMTAK